MILGKSLRGAHSCPQKVHPHGDLATGEEMTEAVGGGGGGGGDKRRGGGREGLGRGDYLREAILLSIFLKGGRLIEGRLLFEEIR